MPRTDDTTVDHLLAELRELTRDVAGDEDAQARRLAVLRRLERHLAESDRDRDLAIA